MFESYHSVFQAAEQVTENIACTYQVNFMRGLLRKPSHGCPISVANGPARNRRV
jgi:hypothetical protein